MDIDPDIRRQLHQQARLWALSLVCATVGAVVIWRTGQLLPGILAFLAALAVLGPVLWGYERRSRTRRRP
jgi:Flp pilus assembly protein TadB